MQQQHQDFKRAIGLSTATALIITSIIGSGIFMRPAEMAGLLGSPILIWLGCRRHSALLLFPLEV
jgi:amino acid transporter